MSDVSRYCETCERLAKELEHTRKALDKALSNLEAAERKLELACEALEKIAANNTSDYRDTAYDTLRRINGES